MGQYYYIVNIDKKQYIHPHKFGDGLKLLEFGASGGGTMCGLAILLSCGNNRGGGDLRSEHPIIGSWAGDRIIVAGDYADEGNHLQFRKSPKWTKGEWTIIKKEFEGYEDSIPADASKIALHAYARMFFKDISKHVVEAMCDDRWIKEDLVKSGVATPTGKWKDKYAEIRQQVKK